MALLPPIPGSRGGGYKAASKRLQETVQHISSQWVPCNPRLKAKLHNMCLRRSLSRKELIEFMLSDPGLCLYIIRSLRRVFPNKDAISLRQAFAEIELEKLAEITSVSTEVISSKDYASASKQQAAEIEHSIRMTKAASVFARKAHCKEDAVQWQAFLHDIGLLLVSWSYPHLYTRALSRKRKTKGSMSYEIHRLLGVTPEEIATEVLHQWRIDLEELHVEVPGDLGSTEIIDLAKMFSRSKDKRNFPEAESNWEKATPLVKEVFGEGVIEEIEECARSSFLPHAATMQHAELPTVTDEPAEEFDEIDALAELSESRILRQLSTADQTLFVPLMKLLAENSTANDALRYIVNTLVPALGFTRGCLFVLNKDGDRVLPVLRFGDLELKRYDEYLFDRYQGMKSFIFQTVPFRRDRTGFAGDEVTYICGGLDSPEHQGVLYLEVSKADESEKAIIPDYCHYFRCCRLVLNDCFQALLHDER